MLRFETEDERAEYFKKHTTMKMVGNRVYYRLSPEAKKQKRKEYAEANKEKLAIEQKQKYEKNKIKYAAQQKEYREKNKEVIKERNKNAYYRSTSERRKYNRKRLYGIDHETFIAMLNNQNNTCDICGISIDETAHVDHCHTTEKVRGLLCSQCNVGVGLLRDDISILNNAIAYLNKHRAQL